MGGGMDPTASKTGYKVKRYRYEKKRIILF